MKIREINASTFVVETHEDCNSCGYDSSAGQVEMCDKCQGGEESLRLRMREAAQNCESAKFQLRGNVVEIRF